MYNQSLAKRPENPKFKKNEKWLKRAFQPLCYWIDGNLIIGGSNNWFTHNLTFIWWCLHVGWFPSIERELPFLTTVITYAQNCVLIKIPPVTVHWLFSIHLNFRTQSKYQVLHSKVYGGRGFWFFGHLGSQGSCYNFSSARHDTLAKLEFPHLKVNQHKSKKIVKFGYKVSFFVLKYAKYQILKSECIQKSFIM